jgi:hypothetical protein
MIGGFPGNSFVFIEFEDGSGVFELGAFVEEALILEIAEFVEGFLELAREAGAVQAEAGEDAMCVDDVESFGLGAAQDVGLEERNAIEAPGCVGQILDQLGFGGVGGLVFFDELAAVELVTR